MGCIEPIAIQSALPNGMMIIGSAHVLGLELLGTFTVAAVAILVPVWQRRGLRAGRVAAGRARSWRAAMAR
jgi:hypothetical protein